MNTITTAELKQRLAAGEKPLLLDVRQPEEHADINIPGSILIPLPELQFRMPELDQYKGQEMIVYCRSGNRSAQACMLLDMFGHTTKNLVGGMLAWE